MTLDSLSLDPLRETPVPSPAPDGSDPLAHALVSPSGEAFRSALTVDHVPEPQAARAPTGRERAPDAAWPRVPGYEILRELGRGGMGMVYQARQVGLDRFVALKMIRAGVDAGSQEKIRFEIESRAVARLQHPNIVQVYEIGEFQDHSGLSRPYIALEYLANGGLDAYLGHKPLPSRVAAALVRTLGLAVHAANRAGVIHRDLKPANVLLTAGRSTLRRTHSLVGPAGTGDPAHGETEILVPKVSDFGLAKLLDGPSGHTAHGAIVGSPSYMAPEQANARFDLIGPATDVYGLGSILYETLTGQPPFQERTFLDTLERVRWHDPVPPRQLNPKVSHDLQIICLKCLHKQAGRRYDSAEELADDLRRFLDGEPVRARPTAGERAGC